MSTVKLFLKEKYNLSNYQIAQLVFLLKTLSSELSKMLIMAILFQNHILLYIFALIIMLCLRCTTGGLHFYTYLSCLVASTIYLWLAVVLLPNFILSKTLRLASLFFSLLICYYYSPVPSKYRPEYPQSLITRCHSIVCSFIFIYTLILYILPENQYLTVGFWVVILHSLQLLVAKIQKKGECLS